MQRVKSYFGLSNTGANDIFSPRTSLDQNECEDVSGLPTYEEARALRLKNQTEAKVDEEENVYDDFADMILT